MKVRIKKFVATTLALVVMTSSFITSTITASASQIVTYTKSTEVFQHVSFGRNGGEKGPITITEGVMKKDSTKEQIYLVTLSGTELVENQSTEIITDICAGLNWNNKYCAHCVSAIKARVPEGSNLMIAGTSLGGMIAQQVAANSSIKENYNVLNIICFGAPLVADGEVEGTIVRLGDTSDIVPYLTGEMIDNTKRAISTLVRETGGYRLDFIKAHVESYGRNDIWGEYDVTGKKFGTTALELDLDTISYHRAPMFEK